MGNSHLASTHILTRILIYLSEVKKATKTQIKREALLTHLHRLNDALLFLKNHNLIRLEKDRDCRKIYSINKITNADEIEIIKEKIKKAVMNIKEKIRKSTWLIPKNLITKYIDEEFFFLNEDDVLVRNLMHL